MFHSSIPTILQGAELIRVSKFYKDSKEGRFISYIHEDVRTLYDAFRRGAKESSEFEPRELFLKVINQSYDRLRCSCSTFYSHNLDVSTEKKNPRLFFSPQKVKLFFSEISRTSEKNVTAKFNISSSELDFP